jgi:3',5'-nucleoside bisphosphate phosphatase
VITGGADLHLHSCRSDGSHEPARVVEMAAGLGLETISLTDHDTVEGVVEAQASGRRFGVRVLSGLELSAGFRGHEIHLLAYAFDPEDPELLRALSWHRRAREERAHRIVDRLNELGIPLARERVTGAARHSSLGRPHIADALLAIGAVSTFQEAFDRYLNPGSPAFVLKERCSLEGARETVHRAGGVLVLAHPHLNLSSGNIQALMAEGIDGLEAVHPKLKPSQSRELAEWAARSGLLATGGSDCHGEGRGPLRMGSVRVDAGIVDRIEQFRRIRACPEAGAPVAVRQGEGP